MPSNIAVALFILLSPLPSLAFETGFLPAGSNKHILAPYEPLEDLVLRSAPASTSTFYRQIQLVPGTPIPYDQVRFRTLKPGLLVAETSGSISGTNYGNIFYLSPEDYRVWGTGRTWGYTKGDTLQYLQGSSKHSAFVRMDDQVIGAPLAVKGISLLLIEDPEIELWIRVLDEGSKPIGWYRVEDTAAAKFLPRSYPPGVKRLDK